ncbi:beta-glucosidase 3B [Olea europaea subsp. europaea]|uniref:Beta-glucosidase 3B n=1 Tax=Olea europaea subsp. europaea TaxID=158383 RepID=A0A8S0TTV7_OLEEU|nr:beta-glucosidase 3B [Olea europaea subsp. europaea]
MGEEYMVYKDAKQPIGVRVKDLLSRMTLEEKIGQMAQIDRVAATADIMKKHYLGSIISGGGSAPLPHATAADWVKMVNDFQKGDPDLLRRIGNATAVEVRATGIPFAFAPCIAVCRDPRWGRCYESYSEDPKIVEEMTDIILGLQGEISNGSEKGVPYVAGKNKVAACAKHFVGTTILSAINSTVDKNTEVVYSENPDSEYVKSQNFNYAVVVVGEHPYTETKGDSKTLTMADPGPDVIRNICGAVKCVVIIISGRPIVIEPYITEIDALVAAWLPGSEGQGVTDVLFGDYGFTGKLPRTWFKTVDQLPTNIGDSHYDPLFPFGFGLTTKATVSR